MDKVYRITHNISKCLKFGETESKRYFLDPRYANGIFEMLANEIDYSNDEWIAFDELWVFSPLGEYQTKTEVMLRYFSDDTKIGVRFNIDEHLKQDSNEKD